MNEDIQKILEENVNPILAGHFGGAKLVSYENQIAKVRLTGACATCPSARFTIESVVKEIVMENCHDVRDVILDMSASDELIDMAQKLMEEKE